MVWNPVSLELFLKNWTPKEAEMYPNAAGVDPALVLGQQLAVHSRGGIERDA